jgi:hypothetical protein
MVDCTVAALMESSSTGECSTLVLTEQVVSIGSLAIRQAASPQILNAQE